MSQSSIEMTSTLNKSPYVIKRTTTGEIKEIGIGSTLHGGVSFDVDGLCVWVDTGTFGTSFTPRELLEFAKALAELAMGFPGMSPEPEVKPTPKKKPKFLKKNVTKQKPKFK